MAGKRSLSKVPATPYWVDGSVVLIADPLHEEELLEGYKPQIFVDDRSDPLTELLVLNVAVLAFDVFWDV